MQYSLTDLKREHSLLRVLAWLIVLVLAACLSASVLRVLWGQWQEYRGLSHGPLIPVIALGHLWARRGEFRRVDAGAPGGLALLILSATAYVGASWADVTTLKSLSLIAMLAGAVWFAAGTSAARAAAGALAILLFMLPWPTALMEQTAYSLQTTSCSYGSMLGGVLGLPIHRDGMHLAVIPNPGEDPVYSVVVAQQCSGFSTFMVLLLIAYLTAYHTRAAFPWRALLVLAALPLAVLLNSVRIALILLAGARFGAAVAQQVHDLVPYPLLFLGVLALMGLRGAFLTWARPLPSQEAELRLERPVVRRPVLALNLLLLLTLGGSLWGQETDRAFNVPPDFLRRQQLPYRGWKTTDRELPAAEQQTLQPHASLLREYRSAAGDTAELVIVAGYRKRTLQRPVYMLEGWELVSQDASQIVLPDRTVPAVRARVTRSGNEMLAVYFFTDGRYSTDRLIRFQGAQVARRLRGEPPYGAMVCLLVPVRQERAEAARLAEELARAALPPVLKSLSRVRAR